MEGKVLLLKYEPSSSKVVHLKFCSFEKIGLEVSTGSANRNEQFLESKIDIINCYDVINRFIYMSAVCVNELCRK